MAEDYERRDTMAYSGIRIGASGATHLRGYAIVFNSLSQNLGGFVEMIAPEAIDRSLREAADIRAMVDHDSGKVIGRTRAGTLALRKDSRGLHVDIEPDTGISYASDIMRAVARGDVDQMSFGFRTKPDDPDWVEWDWTQDPPLRIVRDMRVSEVSIVSFPAYTATDIQVAQRSLQAFHESQRGKSIAWLKKVHRTRMAR